MADVNKTAPGMSGQLSGMGCPRCGIFFHYSEKDLASDKSISCPHCGLKLTLGKPAPTPTAPNGTSFRR